PTRNRFAERLSQLDAKKAAVLLMADPSLYGPEVRARIARRLGAEIESRHRVHGALAITLLGNLTCSESIEILSNYFLLSTKPHRYLKWFAAAAFIRLGHAPAAGFVYEWSWFDTEWYHKEILANIRGSRDSFRQALRGHAVQQLGHPSGTKEHVTAI